MTDDPRRLPSPAVPHEGRRIEFTPIDPNMQQLLDFRDWLMSEIAAAFGGRQLTKPHRPDGKVST